MATRESSSFGLLLQRYRTGAELTQEQLAERAGLSVRGISDLERGARTRPRLYTVEQIADALGLSAEDRVRLEEAARSATMSPAPTSRPRALPSGGFLGALPVGPLIARDEQVARIIAGVEEVEAGAARAVFLSGEPGVGKTRLGQEMSLILQDRGFVVLTGRCYEPQGTVPYYPFLQALGTAWQVLGHDLRREAQRKWPYLGRVLPDWTAPPESSTSAQQEDQQLLFRSITAFLEAMAEHTPVGILLDDLQWADGSSLALLQHIARFAPSARLLLLGTLRDVEVSAPHRLQVATLELAREGLAQVVSVPRLTLEGTAALLEAMEGDAAGSQMPAETLYARTDGNPFFIQEVLRNLAETEDNDAGAIPPTVRAVILQRLSRLHPQTVQILTEASVLGQVFVFDDLEVISSADEDEIEHALEEARAAGLLRGIGKDKFAFNHALTQATLYKDIPARRRRRLHRQVGEALEKRLPVGSERTAGLAYHFMQGEDWERARLWSVRAGDAAESMYAHAEAERQYRQALRLAHETGDMPGEAEALRKLGETLWAAADHDAALQALEEAARLYASAGNNTAASSVIITIANVHADRGSTEAGIARIEGVLGSIDDEDTAVPARAYGSLANLLLREGRLAESVAPAERAIELAEKEGERAVWIRAQLVRSAAFMTIGRVEEGTRQHEELIPLLEEEGNADTLWRVLHNLACVYEDLGDLTRAQGYRARALEAVQRTANPATTSFARAMLGQTLFLLGRWTEARDYLEQAERDGVSPAPSWYLGAVLCTLGWLDLVTGNEERGLSYLQRSLDLVAATGMAQTAWLTHTVLGEHDILRGRPQAALHRLEPLLVQPEFDSSVDANLLVLGTLARASLVVGNVARARAYVDRALTSSRENDLRLFLVEILPVRGLAAGQGDFAGADRDFEEAVELARQMPYPFGAARALHDWGRTLLQRGETKAAQERLELALSLFRELGAIPYIERTEQLRAELPAAR